MVAFGEMMKTTASGENGTGQRQGMVSMNLDEMKSILTRLLEQEEDVLFAYIFGSSVKGTAHPKSDVDVAVYCAGIEAGPDGDMQAVDRQIALSLALERALRRSTDVVVLNRASVDMRQNVLVHGELLFSKDAKTLAHFKRRQLREYQDYIMLEPIFRRYRRRRIEEGTFGGRSDDGAQIAGHH